MKRRRGLLFIFAVILGICINPVCQEACAAGLGTEFEGWVQDDAFLLTDREEYRLEQECERVFEEHQAGVYIVTVEDFGGGDIRSWQRQIFAEYDLDINCGGNGVMLAISMEERDWGLAAFGTAQDMFSTYIREEIGEQILDDLSAGEFYDAFFRYVSLAEDCYTAEEEGTSDTKGYAYSQTYSSQDEENIPVIIIGAFILSLAVSFVIVWSWKKAMNTRVRQGGAMEYLKEGSFRLYNQTDQFLYHRVSKTKRPKENSSGGSGGTHSNHAGRSGGTRSSHSGGSHRMHSNRSGTRGKF